MESKVMKFPRKMKKRLKKETAEMFKGGSKKYVRVETNKAYNFAVRILPAWDKYNK